MACCCWPRAVAWPKLMLILDLEASETQGTGDGEREGRPLGNVSGMSVEATIGKKKRKKNEHYRIGHAGEPL